MRKNERPTSGLPSIRRYAGVLGGAGSPGGGIRHKQSILRAATASVRSRTHNARSRAIGRAAACCGGTRSDIGARAGLMAELRWTPASSGCRKVTPRSASSVPIQASTARLGRPETGRIRHRHEGPRLRHSAGRRLHPRHQRRGKRKPEPGALQQLRREWPDSPYLFVSKQGGPMTTSNVRTPIASVGGRASQGKGRARSRYRGFSSGPTPLIGGHPLAPGSNSPGLSKIVAAVGSPSYEYRSTYKMSGGTTPHPLLTPRRRRPLV
jgi:hypothetical protein